MDQGFPHRAGRNSKIAFALALLSLSLAAVAVLYFRPREATHELTVEGTIALEGKDEVLGNLVSGKLTGSGVASFSFGEYFEANPLISIVEPKVSVKQQKWADGASHRVIKVGRVDLEDKLVAFGDTLAYTLANPSESKVTVKLAGGIQVFSWFNPDFRTKIADLADVRFEHSDGYLRGFYGEGYCVCLGSDRGLIFEVKSTQAAYEVELELNTGDTFVFAVAGATSEREAERLVAEALDNPSMVEESRKREIESMLKGIPSLGGVEAEYEQLWKYLWYVILSNKVSLEGHPVLSHPFNMPSKFVFRHQWLWDSAFHAVVLAQHDVNLAEGELLNLFASQKPDGRIPHEIFLSREFCSLFWDVDDYSPWTTQPPVIAIAVRRIMGRGGSEEFLAKAFEALDRYDRWFRSDRDADEDQLMAYVDYLESGWDNAVRWDEALTLFKQTPEKYRKLYSEIRMAPVEAVDLNCFIYVQRTVLSELAEKLGLRKEAEEYRRLAQETAEAVRRHMWDPDTGFYFDVLEEDHSLLGVKSPAAFITLYAGIAAQDQAEKLLEHLLDPTEFWTTFPLPTVSADDPAYDPKGYWRGRSWINQLWLTYQGLKRYGFEEESRSLAEKVLEIMASKPSCNENYDSSTGEPLGAPDFGWSTLVLDFLADLAEKTSEER